MIINGDPRLRVDKDSVFCLRRPLPEAFRHLKIPVFDRYFLRAACKGNTVRKRKPRPAAPGMAAPALRLVRRRPFLQNLIVKPLTETMVNRMRIINACCEAGVSGSARGDPKKGQDAASPRPRPVFRFAGAGAKNQMFIRFAAACGRGIFMPAFSFFDVNVNVTDDAA